MPSSADSTSDAPRSPPAAEHPPAGQSTLLFVAPAEVASAADPSVSNIPAAVDATEALPAVILDDAAVAAPPTAIPPIRAAVEEVVLAAAVDGEGKLLGLAAKSDVASVGEIDRRPWWQRGWEDYIAAPIEWVFGGLCLLVGLAILASIPIVQFLSLGYLLEVAGRIARTGHLREGFLGFRTAARCGGIVLGISICLAPLWFVSINADAALLIDPAGSVARAWRWGLYLGTFAMLGHIATALYNGGRLRDFFWPVVQAVYGPLDTVRCWLAGESISGVWSWLPPVRLLGDLVSGEAYAKASEGLWNFIAGMHLPHYFWLGLRGFAGAFLWLVIPVTLFAAGSQLPPPVGVPAALLGYVLFCLVLLYLPFVQTHFAAEDRFAAFFELGEVREQFRRAPLAWWIALFVTLAAALPLYLLKIELTPREVTWLPCLVFVLFIWPTKFLLGWAVGAARQRTEPAFFLFRWTSRLLMLPVVMFYAFLVYFTQYLSWNGVLSLYEQHPFLTPVPFLGN